MSDRQPEQIGPYLIKEEVADAGLGRLFQAADPQQEGLFALRLLPTGFLDDPAFRERFSQEMQALVECDHPAIAAARLEQVDGQEWLVRRWLPGGTLAEWLVRGPLAVELAVSIISQIAAALELGTRLRCLTSQLKAGQCTFQPKRRRLPG